jgi:hypothetical protein
MANAQGTGNGSGVDIALKVGHFAGLLTDSQCTVGDDTDACRVISTVLKALESVHDDGGSLLRTQVSDDSTHRQQKYEVSALRRMQRS